jgi:glyoxylase-like metal-dependent hydrolase (beta-lactamase superfamily II)
LSHFPVRAGRATIGGTDSRERPWPSRCGTDGAAAFEDATVRLRGLPRPGHAPDHAVFLLEEERVGHSSDLINIDQLPFGGFAAQSVQPRLTNR